MEDIHTYIANLVEYLLKSNKKMVFLNTMYFISINILVYKAH